jgi:hypothetical protein
MRALDREIDDLNRRRPDWSVAGLPYSTPAFTMDLKIPDPYKNGKLLWPPPQPNLALQYLASMPPDTFIISEAAKGRYIEESRRRMLDDNQRIAEAAQRQREHEEREAAEARKAQEAERAAYYAKHGWPR